MYRFLLVLISFLFIATTVLADERSDTLHQITLAKKEVAELEKALAKLKKQQTTSVKLLRNTETQIAHLEKGINQLKKQLTETESKIAWLKEEQQKTEERCTQQEKVFANQAKATYESGRQEYLKLLLNQQEPDKLSRTLVYYDYISQARLMQLNEYKEAIKQLTTINAEMSHYQDQLTSQNTKLQTQRKELANARKKRLQILAAINKQIKEKNSRIVEREKDQIALNKVLKAIDDALTKQANTQNASSDAPPQYVVAATPTFLGSFLQSRGKLTWPISGNLIARYGSIRDDNRSKWDGVLIAADRGTPVKAIHSGRVVYSDWLRGVGWLIIIDHGQGYYSLYGHNQSLLKKVGNTIKSGDTIATVGNSGGTTNSPALYFSIRQHGQAVNPALWCH